MGWSPHFCIPWLQAGGVSALLQDVATSYFHLWPWRASEDFTASSLRLPPPPSSSSCQHIEVPLVGLQANRERSARAQVNPGLQRWMNCINVASMWLLMPAAGAEAPLQGLSMSHEEVVPPWHIQPKDLALQRKAAVTRAQLCLCKELGPASCVAGDGQGLENVWSPPLGLPAKGSVEQAEGSRAAAFPEH